MLRTHMIRANTSEPMSRDEYRHESNAFHYLRGTLKHLSETTKMNGDQLNGHELRSYGLEVIERLQEIVKEIEEGIEDGKERYKLGVRYELPKFDMKTNKWSDE